MNSLIEALNGWADHALRFAWPMLWQSSLLIAFLFALELPLRRKVRPAVRYALWLVVLVKLLLPPSLAFPTGPGWWLRSPNAAPPRPRSTTVVVTYGASDTPQLPAVATPGPIVLPRPHLSSAAWLLLGTVTASLGLLAWLIARWHQVVRRARRAAAAPSWLNEMLLQLRRSVQSRRSGSAEMRTNKPQRRDEHRVIGAEHSAQTAHLSCSDLQVAEPSLPLRPSRLCGSEGRSSTAWLRLRLTDQPQSPAVCGFFRPVILLPRALAERLPPKQLRAVLLHELFHLRRGDVWVNCAQALLQIVYWWHPLLWFANARIRRVREEAVDDAVMLALRDDAETYAPTLLEVAKLALHRPLATLGLVGIIESRGSLRQRIERLMDFRPPRKAGLTLGSAVAVLGFATLAVPMGEAPPPSEVTQSATSPSTPTNAAPDVVSSSGAPVELQPLYVRTFRIDPDILIEKLNLPKGAVETNGTPIEYRALLALFAEAGVDLDPTRHPGKAIFYHPRPSPNRGMFVVRGTLQDLETIERQIAALKEPAQVPQASGKDAATNSPPPPVSTNVSLLEQKTNARTLVQDGKLLYEMGKLDEAEVKLKQALKQDPHNEAALYYLNLASDAKYTQAAKLHDVTQRQDIRAVEQAWANPVAREALPVPNPYTRTNLVRNAPGRQTIIPKLDRIRFDRVSFDGLPLSEVLLTLAEETRKRDPEGRGVNFVVAQNAASDDTGYGTFVPALSTNRQSEPAPPPALPKVADTRIKISPPLTNIRLADVLDAIVKTADRPIKYSVEDYAIVFSLKTHEPTPLYVRTFKVDPNTFLEGLRAETRLAITSGSSALTPALLGFFARAGADLDPARNPGKSVFFNERQGLLMVRATLQDLDIIETTIQVLNTVPPQINIKAKFVEVPQNDDNALGFDWYLGNVLMTNASTNGRIGAAASTNSPSASPKPGVFFPGSPPAGSNGLSSGIRRDPFPVGSAPPGPTGILTEPQYSVLLKALQQREGTDLIAQPQVTVLSGRQAQCKVVDVRTILKGIDHRALTPPGITSTNDAEGLEFGTESMELGPVLDITPNVLPDGYTINLTLVASLVQFLGYEDNPTNRVTVYVNGKQKQVTPPLPVFRTAQITSQVNVWDGQTLVLGGLVSEHVVTTKDGVPVLGDLPLVGRLFRSESKNAQKRKLLVFITPTIIDPAGNRVHSEDDMPFSREAIPQQPIK